MCPRVCAVLRVFYDFKLLGTGSALCWHVSSFHADNVKYLSTGVCCHPETQRKTGLLNQNELQTTRYCRYYSIVTLNCTHLVIFQFCSIYLLQEMTDLYHHKQSTSAVRAYHVCFV